ncbi:MAG: PIN domain-containing protein [Actinobacteria bacterium]|nr:PIN domain-containing protein [Actinomycetota bacterium]
MDDLLGDDLAICDAISMEILAGARSELHLAQLRGLLARTKLIPITAQDYDQSAALYRTCRRNGETFRRLIDCLIASVAIRLDAPVLHADADFAALARHTPLAIHANSFR